MAGVSNAGNSLHVKQSPAMKAVTKAVMTSGISRAELVPTGGMAAFVVAKASAVALRLETGKICKLGHILSGHIYFPATPPKAATQY